MVGEKRIREHKITIQDLRPLGNKKTLMCVVCGCKGKRDLKKYSDCDQWFNKPSRFEEY